MITLIPITWLYLSYGVCITLLTVASFVIIKNVGLASKWRHQYLCQRELSNSRSKIIEAQRVRLNRSLAAIRKIGFISKGTDFEKMIAGICQEAAKIPPDLEDCYQGKNPNEVDELRDQPMEKIRKEKA